MTYMLLLNCALKLVEEIILYYSIVTIVSGGLLPPFSGYKQCKF